MNDTAREMAEGTARLLSLMRRWENAATTGCDTDVKRAALLSFLEQICGELREVDVGRTELQESREQLAREMAEVEQGREKLKADNEALVSRMHTLEAYSKGLETQKQEIERTATAQAEARARLDERSRLIQGQMMPVEEGVRNLRLSMDDSFGILGMSHRKLIDEFKSSTEDQRSREHEQTEVNRRREEEQKEDRRRCEEERKTDTAAIVGGLVQIYDSMGTMAQEQTALKEETLAKIDSLVDDWVIDRQELEMKIRELTRERDDALFNLSVCKFELKQSKELNDKQANILEEAADLRIKVNEMEPKAEELDQVQVMLEETLEGRGNGSGSAEAVSVVQLIANVKTERQKSVEEAEQLRKQVEELTEQVFESRRIDMDEVMKRTDVLDESRPNMKRKANGAQPEAASENPPKRQRQNTRLEWRNKIDALSSFMLANMPVPDSDGSVSALRAMHLILGAAADLSMLEQLDQWLDEAVEGRWYCFDEVLRAFSSDAEIDGNGCFRHHSSGLLEQTAYHQLA
ncbi:hypothetical protein FHL15_004883 [Xylaria flabelliformis]|uniref:Uncharacterized protein n=1 Tax=Xylaria flabelliformis TaxID=2512241 RepID=A0A553I1M8_9PEZI|nr:hypothetical protein FHL15_004883 [Xylaria flabelliformis]